MEGTIAVSVETIKELVRRFYEAIGREDYGALKEFVHPDFVFYPKIDTPF
ncbi:nuclear transport factor 2 family protein [Planococcus chinensis]|nr:nuclear transport factor 2 family protein [Planococcus chinensis]